MNLAKDWPYIERVAAARLKNNSQRKRHVSQFGEIIEVAGAAGELAARRYFGLPEELHTSTDGGVDFIWKNMTFDVKTIQLFEKTPFLYLQWPAGKPFKSEIILVVAVDRKEKQATIVGWSTKDVVRNCKVNPNRPIPCHELPLKELKPVWRLFCMQNQNPSGPLIPTPSAGY